VATLAYSDAIERVITQLLEDPSVGSLRIVAAEGAVSSGSEGEPIIRFQVTLADPSGDEETWATDDVHRLMRRVVEAVVAENLDLPPVVELQPETPDAAEGSESHTPGA
jgi:hypothetical protein